MDTQTVLSKPHAGTIGHAALEVGAWLVALSSAAISFAIVGIHGFGGAMEISRYGELTQLQRDGGFNSSFAVPGLLAFFALSVVGVLIPPKKLTQLKESVRSQLLTLFAAATACVSVVVVFIPTYWLTLVVAALLGMLVGVLAAHAPELHTKPWRTGGLAVGIFLLVTYYFELEHGVPAGAHALRWLLFVGAILLIAAALMVLVFPLSSNRDIDDLHTFPHTLAIKRSRGHMSIAFPWACYALFAVLGALFILPLPATVDGGYGQGAVGLMIAAVLLGWATGYESGPTFAPGMTRPRLTAFALVAAGLFMIFAGLINELSGKAVVMALTAFSVGVGVRAQKYEFSRRVGLAVGMLLATLLCGLNLTFDLNLSPVTTWVLSASGVAFSAIGLLAFATGILAIFLFSPMGVRGMGVDLLNAFQVPGDSSSNVTPHAFKVSEDQETRVLPGATTSADEPKETGVNSLAVPEPVAPSTGLFIAIEGGDGAGKTTQIRNLVDHLESHGFDPVIATREPGGTPVGQSIRSVLLDGEAVSPKSEALLYAADRAHHVATLINPHLDQGGAVITDRYIDSSLAYQAGGRELSEDDVLSLSRWATSGLVPNLTLVLDIDPRVAAERMGSREDANHLDKQSLEFKDRVRQGFLRLAEAEPERYAVIPAGRSVNEVAEHIQRVVDAVIDGGESTDVADTFEPIAPRGVFEGVPTERMSPEDAQKAVDENRYAEPPQFLTEPIDVDRENEAESAETAAEPDPETNRDKLQRQSMIEQQARQRLRDARRNS
ncbi:dTMP kinase [Brevibacterium paucivorans]